jgi:hypothetical protein
MKQLQCQRGRRAISQSWSGLCGLRNVGYSSGDRTCGVGATQMACRWSPTHPVPPSADPVGHVVPSGWQVPATHTRNGPQGLLLSHVSPSAPVAVGTTHVASEQTAGARHGPMPAQPESLHSCPTVARGKQVRPPSPALQ